MIKLFRVALVLPAILLGMPGGAQDTPKDTMLTVLTLDKSIKGKRLLYRKQEGLQLINVKDAAVTLLFKDLIEARFLPTDQKLPDPAAGSVNVILTNGDTVTGTLKPAVKDRLALHSDVAGDLLIPFETIRMAFFLRPGYSRSRTAPVAGKGDVLRLLSGDEDVGRVISVGTEGVVFQSKQTGQSTFPVKDVFEIHFETLGRAPQDPVGDGAVDVLCHDGSRFRGTLEELDTRTLKMAGVYKGIGSFSIPVAQLDYIHFNNPQVVYLSDLDPAKMKEHPFVETEGMQIFSYQRDHSVVAPDQPIRIKGETFRKGLGVHAYSLLDYKLDGQYKRFTATVGLDDSSGGLGSVVFRVYGDTKKLYESKRIVGTKIKPQSADTREPQAVDVAISGVQELMLVLDFGDDDDVRDRAAWGDARIIKK